MHKDLEGSDITEGFYLDTLSKGIYHVAGEYDLKNKMLITSAKTKRGTQASQAITAHFIRIENPEGYVQSMKNSISWMEQKLSGLERGVNTLIPISQSSPKSTETERLTEYEIPDEEIEITGRPIGVIFSPFGPKFL
jgi:hypothetical protein